MRNLGGYIENLVFLCKTQDVGNRWWQAAVEPIRDGRGTYKSYTCRVYFLPGRPKYGTPDDPYAERQGSPPFGTALIHWRR
jgi:hypothetical protein